MARIVASRPQTVRSDARTVCRSDVPERASCAFVANADRIREHRRSVHREAPRQKVCLVT